MNALAQQDDALRAFVERALEEDRAWEDRTSQAVVPEGVRARGRLLAKQDGVLAGTDYFSAAVLLCDPDARLDWRAADGGRIHAGDLLLRCEGRARGLLAAERTALNFLQHLSGIATATSAAVAESSGLLVLDTRKTTPGMRDAEKAAVRAGGGVNHRRDLADQLLLKENHFSLSGRGYAETVAAARAAAPRHVLGAEARTLEEARAALAGGADYVLLDNFSAEQLAQAAGALRQEFPEAVLEASGGLGAADLPRLAGAGLSRASMGRLTHSAPALDFSLLIEPLGGGGAA